MAAILIPFCFLNYHKAFIQQNLFLVRERTTVLQKEMLDSCSQVIKAFDFFVHEFTGFYACYTSLKPVNKFLYVVRFFAPPKIPATKSESCET